MGIERVLFKTLSNGRQVRMAETVANGVRTIRTTIIAKEEKRIIDRLKTVSKESLGELDVNVVTKNTYGKMLGESFTKGTYSVSARGYSNHVPVIRLDAKTTPTTLKDGGWRVFTNTSPRMVGKHWMPQWEKKFNFKDGKVAGTIKEGFAGYATSAPFPASLSKTEIELTDMVLGKNLKTLG